MSSDYERRWLKQNAIERSHNADYRCRRCGTRFRQYINPGDEWQTCPKSGCNEKCYPYLIKELNYDHTNRAS